MLNNVYENMKTASNRFDITMAKINLFSETAMDQLDIDYAKSRLKVFSEGGDGDDLEYLQKGAFANAIAKIKKAIEKIIEAFKKFCNEVKLKVLTLITSKETKDKLDEVEKKVKFNPFLSRKKVEIADKDKQLKVIDWAYTQYQKVLAKIKGGKEVESDEIDDIEDETRSRLSAVSTAGALITVPLAVALSMLKKAQSGIGNAIDGIRKPADSIMGECKDQLSKDVSSKAASNLQRLASSVSSTGKTAVQIFLDWIRSTLIVIKGAVSKLSGNIKDTVSESSYDDFLNSMANDLLIESSNDLLNELENDLFNESSNDNSFERWVSESSRESKSFDYDSWLNESSNDINFNF